MFHIHRFNDSITYPRIIDPPLFLCRCGKGDWKRYERDKAEFDQWMRFWKAMHWATTRKGQ